MPTGSLKGQPMAGVVGRTWAPGPLRPRLADGAVHVWRADLSTVSDDLIGVLSTDEQARADRILNAVAGERWARAHGVLRVLLGRYLSVDPHRLRFATEEHGKPALIGGFAPALLGARSGAIGPRPLSFSLSHSGGVALYGFSRTSSIGVDVEVSRRSIDHIAVATRAFEPNETRQLALLEPTSRAREFLRLWVRHEAESKYLGIGISRRPPPGTRAASILDLNLGEEAAAAVAVERLPRDLRCWCW